MANIALDIKANTSKALGEFKKLSRELDNKFLVQGLKLDVVKNAFRQINREFEQSLGQQGFNTTETTNQLQRNAAANLAILNKLGTDSANEVTRSVRKNLQFLQAEGRITGETVKEALTAASFFDFSGSEAEVKRQFESFTNNFATVSQDLSDAFGESGAGQFQKVLTGQASLDDLFGVDFGPGGASKNLILKAIRENYGNIDAVTGAARTDLIKKILADFQDVNTDVGKILDDQKKAARVDDPFRQIQRELQGLFSPQGLFGNLRQIGGTFRNLDGQQVPRNLLQLTAKLIRTIFDKDDGLFAVLGKTLGEAFGFDPKNILAPILNGVELFTLVIERLREFFASASFKRFLTIFEPIQSALEGIKFKDGLSAFEINTFIDGLFESIRGLLGKASEFIKKVDISALTSILGNVASEIANTIPSILGLVFEIVKKGFVAAGGVFDSADGPGKLLIAAIVGDLITKLTTGKGIFGNLFEFLGKKKDSLLSSLNEGIFGKKSPAAAARGSEAQRWTRLYLYLENILRALNGQGPLDDLPGGRNRRLGRPSRRAVNERFERRFGRRVPRGARFRRGLSRGVRRIPGLSALNNTLRIGVPKISNALGGLSTSTKDLISTTRANTRIQANQFRAGFNRPPVALPGSSSRAFRAGEVARNIQRRTQNLPRTISTQASRATQAVRRIPEATGATQAVRRIPEATRGLNARMMRTTPEAAARYTQRFGQFAGARRGITSLLGRAALPLLAAGTIFSAASILGAPGAKAEELEEQGYSKEEIEQIRKQEKRDKTRGLTGIAASLAGGAAGGAAGVKLGGLIGTAFGPIGTAIGAGVGGVAGGILGSIFGEQAVNALSDPIIDGITSFGENIGSFFSGLWSNISSGFSSAIEGLGNFFGSEGPIQRFARWYFSLPGNIAGGIFGAITGFFSKDGPIQKVGKFFMDLPGKVAKALSDAWSGLTSALAELPGTILSQAFGWMGGLLPDQIKDTIGLDDKEEEREPSPNFAGGFNLIGGRTSFNEREAIGMPDGVTYIPLTSSTTLDKFVGKTIETTNNMEVTINVNGAADPRQVAQAVIEEIDNVFKSITSTT